MITKANTTIVCNKSIDPRLSRRLRQRQWHQKILFYPAQVLLTTLGFFLFHEAWLNNRGLVYAFVAPHVQTSIQTQFHKLPFWRSYDWLVTQTFLETMTFLPTPSGSVTRRPMSTLFSSKSKAKTENTWGERTNKNAAYGQFDVSFSKNSSVLTFGKNRQSIALEVKNARSTLQQQDCVQKDTDGKPVLDQTYCDRMLALCVARDEWDLVLDVLDIMKQCGLQRDKSTYRTCLQACFDVSNAAASKEVAESMEKAGIPLDPTDLGLVVATMCRSKGYSQKRGSEGDWWGQALVIANIHDNLPIEAYDAVLSCMTPKSQWKEAILLLRKLESALSTRSMSMTNTSTTSIKTQSTQPAVSTYKIVIECCIAAQQIEQAVQILESCIYKAKLIPMSYAFELVVVALSRKLRWRRALQVVTWMDDLNLPKTLVMYNSILSACCKTKDAIQAKSLLIRMQKSDELQPDIISYNCVLSACVSTNRWKDALTIFDQCHRFPGVVPDVYTYTNAIRACAKGGQTRRALTLLQVVKDKRLPIDTYCYTAAIDACAKAKLWKRALELLAEMESKHDKLAPSEITYSVAISACGNGGQWQKALDLLNTMRQKKMKINLITYNAAITALSKAAKQVSKFCSDDSMSDNVQFWPLANQLMDQMRSEGVEPDGFTYSAAITCCGSEGRWKEALHLLELMQKGGPQTRPNKIAYTAAISSCGKVGQVEHALRLFRQMSDEGFAADRVAYNALFSALRVAKRADIAFTLWNEMTGSSSDNTTFTFNTLTNQSITPDIITVTDAIAAFSSEFSLSTKEHRDKVDIIFAEAVDRGVVLCSSMLDSLWEVDFSGMSLPVARAACRYVISKIARRLTNNVIEAEAVTFITGVGKGDQRRQGDVITGVVNDHRPMASLQEYVQECLLNDFDPPLKSHVPQQVRGTVQIDRNTIVSWINMQSSRR